MTSTTSLSHPSMRAALAAQITELTHITDSLEQLLPIISVYGDVLERQIASLHSTIDALNALYESETASEDAAPALRAALDRLVHCPDLNLDNMDDRTYAAIEAAKDLLYPSTAS